MASELALEWRCCAASAAAAADQTHASPELVRVGLARREFCWDRFGPAPGNSEGNLVCIFGAIPTREPSWILLPKGSRVRGVALGV